jgi:pectin methylesterase-like acyl-CoA thioesterase/lysophospholipase L1-like esterase
VEIRSVTPIPKAFFCGFLFVCWAGYGQYPAQVEPHPQAKIKIVLVGDSTVNDEGGWGPGFCALMTPNVECINLARNGRSSKSYYDEGLWTKVLAQHADYILIQFGHNDMPGKGPLRETDPDTSYAANIRRYIEQARVAGARPVIVTSLSRRNYKDGRLIHDLDAYANAAKRVAAEEDAPVIDLNAASVKLLETMSQEQADGFDAAAHSDAASKGPDRTHLNARGSTVFGSIVAESLSRGCPELGPDIKGNAIEHGAGTAKLRIFHVAADGTGDFHSIQEAIDAAPDSSGALILVAPGTYRELVAIEKPGIQIRSPDPDASKTVVVYDRSANTSGGTSHTATVNVSGDNFFAENITFQNDFKPTGDPYPEGSQAVALRVTGDRAIFRNVRLLGHQDTLYAASKGCAGTGEVRTCQPARQYFSDCYIEGNFDFIFGDSKMVIDHSEIHSKLLVEGFITAQSKIFPQQDSGYVIYKSKLTADTGVGKVYLGRPWRPYSTVTYIDTEMGDHIEPAGWREWLPGKTQSIDTATYSESGSTGPGAHPSERDPHTHFLTSEQARQYEPSIFLKGNDNWNPVEQVSPPLP